MYPLLAWYFDLYMQALVDLAEVLIKSDELALICDQKPGFGHFVLLWLKPEQGRIHLSSLKGLWLIGALCVHASS